MKRRKLFDKLLKEKDNKKISIVLGARQVGKTTILKTIYENLSQKNKCLFLDLDIVSDIEKISTFENLVNTLNLNGYSEKQNEFFYLFLDEFQKYKELTLIMKNVYDNFDNVKIYASGSSSLTIKEQIQESLAGRKTVTVLYPLDFEEFLWFKEEETGILANTKKLSGENLIKVTGRLYTLLNEFMIFGGYPEVVLQKNEESKINTLKSIFDLYVDKDIVDYLKVEKILNVKRLIEYLAVNNCQKIKYEEISKLSSLNYLEIKEYIEILKETYIIFVLRPFFTNKNKELVKIPKIYFIDNGVRNFFVNNFNPLHLREDKGFLFEGYVLSELLKLGENNLRFWQDKNMHEVDIIIERQQTQLPIEIKFKEVLKNEDFLGIRKFLEEYPSTKKGYIISIGSQKEAGNIQIKLPYLLDFL